LRPQDFARGDAYTGNRSGNTAERDDKIIAEPEKLFGFERKLDAFGDLNWFALLSFCFCPARDRL
jgi:hypothetical protein